MQNLGNSAASRDKAHLVHPMTNLQRHLDVGPTIMARGKGVYVYDDAGKEYIEGMAGLWCASLGFAEDRLVKAATDQLRKLPYYQQFRHMSHGPGIDLAEKLVSMTPPGLNKAFFVNSGSEANDTIVKLICRLYDPVRGALTWDGVDLRDLEPDALRERIATVFQDYAIYELSAAENIGVGDLTQLEERRRLESAAELAGIHRTIESLPAGYATLISRIYTEGGEDADDPDSGVLLSGGQGQRLALARAFVRGRRDLLILDEPSAGLDPEAEATIHQRIREHRSGGTSLLISHRLNTVRDADRITVLESGKIAEHGDHASLQKDGGIYARLFDLQSRGYTEPAASS
jgi:ATP-binding cassette, subfamily B, bacterial